MKMKLQKITTIIIVACAIALILWDIYALVYGGGEATISYVIANLGKQNRMIPLVFGVLIGHFFWPIESMKE